jgi:hypothetical protein
MLELTFGPLLFTRSSPIGDKLPAALVEVVVSVALAKV